MQFDRLPMFKCRACGSGQKKLRGCVRPFKRKQVWQIDECYYCGGAKKSCVYCKGRGKVSVGSCPRAMLGGDVPRLLPFFSAYRNSNSLAWPDGRGRYYQPCKLIEAFDLWSYYFNKFETKAIKDGK